MAKSNRGGKAGANSTLFTIRQPAFHPVTNSRPTSQPIQQQAPQPTPQPAPQPAPQPIVQNAPSATFDAFKKMTDDQKADAILQAAKTPVPVFLAQNDLQKVLYGLQLNDKPTLVDDSVLDTMPGKDLFRTVNETKDLKNRIKYSADEIAAQVIKGSVTRVSDTGGSAHGRGIYFADSYRESIGYGNVRGNIKDTAVIRAKLSPTARIVNETHAERGVSSAISSGSKLGKTLQSVAPRDRTALWALAKGYDGIKDDKYNTGYHVIINRSALVASKSIKAMGSSW